MQTRTFFRILIVEDDSDRLWEIKSWMPPDVVVSNVTDAGIMLDHDLQEQLKVASSMYLSGVVSPGGTHKEKAV